MNSPAVEGRLDRGVRTLVERLRRYVDPGWGSALRDMHDAADELERLALLLAQGLAPAARVAEVHMSRYTLEWLDGPLPEGTVLHKALPSAQPFSFKPQRVREG